jgi:hypothetical protein
LRRAVADENFCASLLEDPSKAISDVVGKKQKTSLAESQRKTLSEILQLAAHDKAFRTKLEQDPVHAIEERGFLKHSDGNAQDARYWCLTTFIYVGNPD